MKSKTIEEALQLIPTHIMLRPGVDVWKSGDSFFMYYKQEMQTVDEVIPDAIGEAIGILSRAPIVRKIPENVRQAMARYMTEPHEGNAFTDWLMTGDIPGCTRCGHYVCKCDEAYS